MVRVKMSDDIRKYDTKFMGAFSKRQTICLAFGIVFGAVIAALLPFGLDISILTGVSLASPVILCGFVKINGCTFEVIALRYIYKQFLTPRKRKIKRITPLHMEYNKAKKRAERKRMQKMTPRQKKQYLKRTVTYSEENHIYR